MTENLLEPLKSELGDIDREISDQIDRNAAIKSNILANDDKIHQIICTTRH